MKTIVLSVFYVEFNNSLYTGKQDRPSAMKAIPAVPFLTRQNDFVYVDKTNLKSVINQKFKSASVFTPTGYAVVENEKGEYAVIDETGKVVLDFSPSQISLNVVNGLTFYKKDIEYGKKMPFWKWEWNIMGSGIGKEQTYHTIQIEL